MARTQQDQIINRDTALSRRAALQRCGVGLAVAGGLFSGGQSAMGDRGELQKPNEPRPWINVRGIYGGFPNEILDRGLTPADLGVNAIWVGSGGLKADEIARYHDWGVKVFAEFNSMHHAGYLKEHPEAAPVGSDGKPCPAPEGWQGVSPHHSGYRRNRMEEFRRVLESFEIDGIWLDYHHAHASWERAVPLLPDTDFSEEAIRQFRGRSGIDLPDDVQKAAKQLLGPLEDAWTQFRCDVFTDWVREYREILDATRPQALLGTFHCPWSPEDYDGALRRKLAIDLPAQKRYVDVFSIMPYHARFGHLQDPAWISRRIVSLGKELHLSGRPDEKTKIWPIVQLADWGEPVPIEQVPGVLDHGTRSPATGVMIFHWSGVSRQWEKVEVMADFYRSIRQGNS